MPTLADTGTIYTATFSTDTNWTIMENFYSGQTVCSVAENEPDVENLDIITPKEPIPDDECHCPACLDDWSKQPEYEYTKQKAKLIIDINL